MEYGAILFDLDGTLIDSLPGIEYAVDQALAELGLPPHKESLRGLIGPPIRRIFSLIVDAATEEQLNRLEKAFRESYDGGAWRRTVLHASAVSTIKTLYESGMRLFVVTNKPTLPTQAILQELGLARYFEALVSRDSRRPPFTSKAEMLRSVVEEYRLEPKACLYVGDTSEDYDAGVAAGMGVALVLHGYGAFDSLGFPAASLPLANLPDLLQFAERVEIS